MNGNTAFVAVAATLILSILLAALGVNGIVEHHELGRLCIESGKTWVEAGCLP